MDLATPASLRATERSDDEVLQGIYCARTGNHLVGQHRRRQAELRREQTLEDGAQIHGRLQVPLLMELVIPQTWPIGDHAAALDRASDEECDGPRSMIGAGRAVDARRTAK